MQSSERVPRGSVRTQLVVTNIAVLTVLLGILGVVIHYAVASTIVASVDRQLETRTRAMAGMHPPGPPPGFHGFGFGHFPWIFGGHRQERVDIAPGSGQRPGSASPMPPSPPFDMPPHGPDHGPGGPPFIDDGHHPPAPTNSREFRELDKFRPRRFGLDGRSADPFPTYTPWSSTAFAQSKSGLLVLATITVDGQHYRMISSPYPLHGPTEGVVQDVYPLADVERALRGVDRVLWLLSPVALICAGLAGWVLTGRVLARVRNMTQAAARIGSEDFSRRIPISGHDEFSQLGDTFNNLLGRLEGAIDHERQLGEQQRRFTADASHELKTPLTIIKGNTDMALTGASTVEDYRDALKEIGQAAGTMDKLVRDLLLLARADAGRLAQSRIELLLNDVLHRAASSMRRPGQAEITIDAPADLVILGNEDELTRLFTNLIDNAARHTPEEGHIRIEAAVDDHVVRVKVIDNGSGIEADHLPHLGERFYRVDTARARVDGGTGLGLSICKSIAVAHGGSIAIDSAPGCGTTVTVTLPLGAASA